MIRLATWNIHGGVGADGHFVPNRIVDVLRELHADVIALQEVESGRTGFDMLAWLAERCGMHSVAGPTLVRGGGDYGNALLSRFPVASRRLLDLSVPGREPRGAIVATLDTPPVPMRVIATHLGLAPAERRAQVRRLLAELTEIEAANGSALESAARETMVLMGDVNEWSLWGRPLRWLHRWFEDAPAPRSFPARLPLFALDRIWVKPRPMLVRVAAHRSRLARIASDHLPVVAVVDPGPAVPGRAAMPLSARAWPRQA
ncbi:endonuclease/exonuclease/phosphatase family protein [Derxia gummosa]|uniref:Endonuclease/exonuclease/phosphatase family protein n=1 Tax=Derxia gummosa DSM 723 TaxID=1121388 RepID=A0A9W3ECN6_9BURK|nr:endonuclease/exonuclease/phosphatase family protein [Derxia gummosa]